MFKIFEKMTSFQIYFRAHNQLSRSKFKRIVLCSTYRTVHFQTIKSVLRNDDEYYQISSALLGQTDSKLSRKPSGTIFTDHMLKIEYDQKVAGWKKSAIIPVTSFDLNTRFQTNFNDPRTIFESMNGYKGIDGNVRLFRPRLKFDRFNKAAAMASLPQVDAEFLLNQIENLIKVDRQWIPTSSMSSLDVRTSMTAINNLMGDGYAQKVVLYVVLSPRGPYFEKHQAIRIMAVPRYEFTDNIRLNLNPYFHVQNESNKYKCHQTLWLHGIEEQITQTTSMNIFLLYRNDKQEVELATPPLNGLIFPGVTRVSILELAKSWNINIREQEFRMSRIVKLIQEDRLLEMFGCGGATVVCPISEMMYKEKLYKIPTMIHSGTPLYLKFYNKLINILYGKISHNWASVIDTNRYTTIRNL